MEEQKLLTLWCFGLFLGSEIIWNKILGIDAFVQCASIADQYHHQWSITLEGLAKRWEHQFIREVIQIWPQLYWARQTKESSIGSFVNAEIDLLSSSLSHYGNSIFVFFYGLVRRTRCTRFLMQKKVFVIWLTASIKY